MADVEHPLDVAASSTLLAVSQATPTAARVLVFDLFGNIVVAFGGDPLSEGEECCEGARLGYPVSLAVSTGSLPTISLPGCIFVPVLHGNCSLQQPTTS